MDSWVVQGPGLDKIDEQVPLWEKTKVILICIQALRAWSCANDLIWFIRLAIWLGLRQPKHKLSQGGICYQQQLQISAACGGATAMVFFALTSVQWRRFCLLAMFTDSVLWPLTSFFLLRHCEICSLPQGIVRSGRGVSVGSCRLLQLSITSFISDILFKATAPVS